MYPGFYNTLRLDRLTSACLDHYQNFFNRQFHHHILVTLLILHLQSRNFHRYKNIPTGCKYYGYQIRYLNRTLLFMECGIVYLANDSSLSTPH